MYKWTERAQKRALKDCNCATNWKENPNHSETHTKEESNAKMKEKKMAEKEREKWKCNQIKIGTQVPRDINQSLSKQCRGFASYE